MFRLKMMSSTPIIDLPLSYDLRKYRTMYVEYLDVPETYYIVYNDIEHTFIDTSGVTHTFAISAGNYTGLEYAEQLAIIMTSLDIVTYNEAIEPFTDNIVISASSGNFTLELPDIISYYYGLGLSNNTLTSSASVITLGQDGFNRGRVYNVYDYNNSINGTVAASNIIKGVFYDEYNNDPNLIYSCTKDNWNKNYIKIDVNYNEHSHTLELRDELGNTIDTLGHYWTISIIFCNPSAW